MNPHNNYYKPGDTAAYQYFEFGMPPKAVFARATILESFPGEEYFIEIQTPNYPFTHRSIVTIRVLFDLEITQA